MLAFIMPYIPMMLKNYCKDPSSRFVKIMAFPVPIPNHTAHGKTGLKEE
jgi:hypothetical protein